MAPETQSEARLRGLEIKLESTLVEMRSTNGKLDRIAESIERHIDETDGHFHKIDAALRGQNQENPGLFVRVSALEGFMTRSRKAFWAAISTIGAVISTLAAKVFE